METQPHVATMPVRELQLLHEAGLTVEQVIDAAHHQRRQGLQD